MRAKHNGWHMGVMSQSYFGVTGAHYAEVQAILACAYTTPSASGGTQYESTMRYVRCNDSPEAQAEESHIHL